MLTIDELTIKDLQVFAESYNLQHLVEMRHCFMENPETSTMEHWLAYYDTVNGLSTEELPLYHKIDRIMNTQKE